MILQKIFGNAYGKYQGLSSGIQKFIQDARDLMMYVDQRIDHIATKSQGLIGAYSDIVDTIPAMTDKFNAIKSDYKNLESVLRNNNNTPQVSQPIMNTNNASSPSLPSSSKHISTYTPKTKKSSPKKMNYVQSKKYQQPLHNSRPKTHLQYTKGQLNTIIQQKNRYTNSRFSYLEDKISKDNGIPLNDGIEHILRYTMTLRSKDPKYGDLERLNYDDRIASYNMKKELVNKYISSDMTLNELSGYLESKYGMHISTNTISKHARRQINEKLQNNTIHNRREARTLVKRRNSG